METTQRELDKIQQGSKLELALKTEQGRVIAEELIEQLVEKIMEIIDGTDGDSSEEILISVYQARGLLDAIGVIGDKMAFARKIAEKKIRENLRSSD